MPEVKLDSQLVEDLKSTVEKQVSLAEERKQENENLRKELEATQQKIDGLETRIQVTRNPAITLKEVGRWTGGELTENRARYIGWMASYMKAVASGEPDDWDVFNKFAGAAKTVVNVNQLMPEELYPNIWSEVIRNSVFMRDAMRIQQGVRVMYYPYLNIGLNVHIVGDNAQKPEDNATFQRIKLEAKTLASFTVIGLEEIADSLPGMVPTISRNAAQQFGRFVDNVMFSSQDAAASGMGDSLGEIIGKKVDIGTTETVTYAQLWQGVAQLDSIQRQGARWYMSHEIWAKIRGIVDTQGQPVWQESLSNSDFIGTLFGYPVVLVDAMALPATGVKKPAIILGNLGLIPYGDRATLQLDVSDHFKFQNDQRCFRWVMRVALPELPNAAADRAPLTNYFCQWEGTGP